jgi:hypothetical protein
MVSTDFPVLIFRLFRGSSELRNGAGNISFSLRAPALNWVGVFRMGSFTLRKLECSKQANFFLGGGGSRGQPLLQFFSSYKPLNTSAWNNETGLDSYFVGFRKTGND